MIKVQTALLRVVGRLKKMLAEVIAQYGAALLALSAVVAIFAYGERATTSTIPLWILAILFFGMGAQAFRQALKHSKQETDKQRNESTRNELRERQMIVLLSAIAKTKEVDSEELLKSEEEKMRQDEVRRIFDKAKRGDAL